jgi:hypothetical protein
MVTLGALAFAAPWALAAVAALPVLWWLLRVTPPSPRVVRFPAIRLLFGLEAREDAAARTPWWVLVLRLALALALILAVAHPLLNPGRPLALAAGPLVVAVDDGWAAARDWPARRAWLIAALARAERAGRPVILLPTAPPADGAPVAASPLMPAAEARALAQALEPKPWPTDRAAAAEAVKAIARDQVIEAVWLSDGLDDAAGSGAGLARALQTLGGGLDLVTGATGRLLLPPAEGGNPLTVTLRRLTHFERPEWLALRAVDGAGRVLAREDAALAAGETETNVALRLPGELRNRLARLDIETEAGAAAVVLLDERWRRRPVGVAASGDDSQPLLAQLYYVERALAPHAELHKGEISELLARQLAMMVLADVPAVLGTSADRLRAWVEGGGVLVRFAGPELARAAAEVPRMGDADPLLPVRLRDGGRAMGGTMSWTSPQGLAPFPPESPFAGLAIPEDIRVTSQVLAEPSLELADRTWARLADGTPLVTAERRGKGWVVLVHTSANAAWSNLALSGLFVDMLRRLTTLAEGVAGAAMSGPLPPVELLDGFGRLTAPTGAATAIAGPPDALRPGPRHPPGFYGQDGARVAINLAPRLPRLVPLAPPPGVTVAPLEAGRREIDLKPMLLVAALLLAMADLVASLALRGLLRRGQLRRSVGAAVVALLVIPEARAADAFAMEAALATRLAYIRTNDAALDRKSHAGLRALSQVVGQRSTASLAEPLGVDVEKDPVLFFPLLYWPLAPGQKPPSGAAAEKLNAYMRAGGLIVLDTGAGADAAGLGEPDVVKVLTGGLAIPALAPVTDDHVLARSFYLLKEMPGRWDGAVWVGTNAMAINDGVSPVVVGGNDWAGAWALDDRGRPLFATVPGGERQRELAYRFGINLVMYALTGNYKADQVHLPAILERLGR